MEESTDRGADSSESLVRMLLLPEIVAIADLAAP